MRTVKGQLYYHTKRKKWCVVLRGGNNTSRVNFNNKKVVSELVDNTDLTKGYSKSK